MQGTSEGDAIRIFLQKAIATRRLHSGQVQDFGLIPLSDEEKAYLLSVTVQSRTRAFMEISRACQKNATAQVAVPNHAQVPQQDARQAQRHQEPMMNDQLQQPHRERNASEPLSDDVNPMDQPGAPKRERIPNPQRPNRRYDWRYSLSEFSSAQFEDFVHGQAVEPLSNGVNPMDQPGAPEPERTPRPEPADRRIDLMMHGLGDFSSAESKDFVHGQAVPSILHAYPSQHLEPESSQERESSAMEKNHVAPWLTSNVEDEDENEEEEKYCPPLAKYMRLDQEAPTSQRRNYERNVMHLQHVRNLQSAQ